MGSKLGTLSESPTRHSSAAVVDGDGASPNGNGVMVDGSSSRRRHSHSRRPAGGQGQPNSLSALGSHQRQRAASTSDALGRSVSSTDGAVGSSGAAGISANERHPRGPGAQRQYSLFGHYWDAFLNSDSSSDDDEVDDSEGDDDSSSSSEQRRRGQNDRHHYNRRRNHRNSSPFFTSSSNTAASTSANNALPIRISSTAVSSSMALSRASNRRRLRALIAAHSLPFPLFSVTDFKCPICHKTVPSEDIELHVVVCLTKPRIDYNVDVLSEDKGECIICFDEMYSGDTIARLPCLCIYHKRCIDQWFDVRRACPAHPPDED